MKKKILLIFMVIMAIFLLTACGSVQSQTNEKNTSKETVASDAEVMYPLSIVDQAGREIEITQRPQSVVSSYYITTSVILALGLQDELKGMESNPEKRPLYEKCGFDFTKTTMVGSPKEFDIEACSSIQPDLVILPMRAKDMVEPLEKLGITVMIVNPESQDEILEMIHLIAKATGKTERGDELVSYIQDKIDMLSEKMEGCERPTVYLGGNSSFFSTASKGMYQNDLISLAGGDNVAGDIDDTYWVESSYEQILAWNPQVIVMASDASYSIEEIQTDANLASCQAIKENSLYKIPSDVEAWDSPVPSSFLGAVYLASVLHPDLVTNEQYEDMVEEYYETFYGFSYGAK